MERSARSRWPECALIDGYARVGALETLGRHDRGCGARARRGRGARTGDRLETARRRTALEEGWLLATLLDVHGMRARELAVAFGKTPSWVSRRRALVRALPEAVQDAVRAGRVCVHGAEKFLVPLARANASQCARLVERLGDARPTVRQLGRLYAAWRAADAVTRARIAENPLLHLKVEEAVATPVEEDDLQLLGDVEAIAGACGRARKRVRDGGLLRFPAARRAQLEGAWKEARLAFAAVSVLFAEGELDVGP